MGWVLPMGTPGGVVSGFTGIPAGTGVVRLGSTIMLLDAERYRMWEASAGAPERDELVYWAESEGIASGESLVRTLKDAELLIEERGDARLQAGRIAVRLLGSCVGNGDSADPVFMVRGHAPEPISVNMVIYDLLLHCDGVDPVLELCDLADQVRPEVSRPPSVEVLFDWLPLLVRSGVVRLDLAAR